MDDAAEAARTALAGSVFAILAYGFWGIAPLYFRALDDVGAFEIVAHRVLWTALLLLPILAFTQSFGRLKAALTTPKVALTLLISGTLIGANWLIFILAILDARVLEASLGYFINPLVSLALGIVVLKERPTPLQFLAMAVAGLGVLNEVVRFGAVPWLGLALAGSFAIYGLLRKQVAVDAFVGLTVESWLLLPVAGLFLLSLPAGGAFLRSGESAAWLMLAGPVTMFPLLCFAAAATRLALGTLGFFQYLAPSLQFLLAIWVFQEPFDPAQWWTFGLIWLGLALFSLNMILRRRRLP